MRVNMFKSLFAAAICWLSVFSVSAAPYAAVVMDARDGRVYFSQNGKQPLHPASLTKMMTLYIAFAEVTAGRISLETDVRISARAAAAPPSKIGLRAGSTMKLKYLIRAAAIKSANDAALAIAEAIAGSEENFAKYMSYTAAKLGMQNSQFKNAHGLTSPGHYSTAYDMAILGRHMIYDYPNFYHLFSSNYAQTPIGNFPNSNVRFLSDYPGADGIKTGYTRAAGYNLVATAKRGNERVLVSMFGGQSSYQRNEQVGALLDLGFKNAPSTVKLANLSRPRLPGVRNVAPQNVAPQVEVAKKKISEPAPVAPKQVKTASQTFAPRAASRPASRPLAAFASAAQVTASASASPVATKTASITKPPARSQNLNIDAELIRRELEGKTDLAVLRIERPAARPAS